MKEEIIGGLVVAAVIGIVSWLWRSRGAPACWFRREIIAAAEAEVADGASQLQVLREQVLDVARSRGILVASTSAGHNPTVVTFSDGSTSWFFSDLQAYQRAVNARRADPLRSRWNVRPPAPVSRWDRERLQAWLDENAD